MAIFLNTPMIKVETKEYPRFIPDIRPEFPNMSIPDMMTDDKVLEPYGFAVVYPTNAPDGDVVKQGVPEYNEQDEKWYMTWTSRPFTPEEIAQRLATAKQNLVFGARSTLDSGWYTPTSFVFNGETYQTTLSPSDIALFQTVYSLASSGARAEPFQIQFEDKTLSLSSHDTQTLLTELLGIYYDAYRNFWNFLNSVGVVTDIKDLPDLPSTFISSL